MRTPEPIIGRRVDVTACEWRIGAAGLEELRIVERAQVDGTILYAVKWLSYTASKTYRWVYEPIPSSRDEDYIAECRFADWAHAYDVAIRMPLDSTGAIVR